MNWKNRLLLRICFFLSPKKQRSSKPHRILIVSTTALGDTLWGSPAIVSLKQSFPNALISILTSPIGKEIFKTSPHISKLYCIDRPLWRSFFPLLFSLKKENFDTLLVFHASQRLVFPLCFFLGAERFIGSSGINKGLDALFTKTLPSLQEHEIERRLRLVEEIGGIAWTKQLTFHLNPQEKKLLPDSGPWIALHPGSKDAFKRWPKEHFIALGQKLSEHTSMRILITGNKSEQMLMQEIQLQIPGSVCLTPSSLHSFAHILEQVALLISNDTGPFHLACALNTPAIAIYGATNPELCGPYLAENALALYKPVPCTPCLKRSCLSPFCLLQIGPQDVLQECLKLLASKKGQKVPSPCHEMAQSKQ
jgi:ADP-heptose:LPS heptosyltransferase